MSLQGGQQQQGQDVDAWLHLEGWDVLYNHLECHITKPVCYITILQMLYNMCYITRVI